MHIVASLMNIQMKFYESILNGKRVTTHLNQWPLAHTTTSLLRRINVRLNIRGLFSDYLEIKTAVVVQCGGPKNLPVHPYSVVIFTFSGPLGL